MPIFVNRFDRSHGNAVLSRLLNSAATLHYTPQQSGYKAKKCQAQAFDARRTKAFTSSACVTLIKWPPLGIMTSASTRRAGIKGSRLP